MKKKILSIVLSFTMVFSTTGFAFADTDLDNSPTEPTKVEKEVEEPPQEKTKKEEIKEEPKEEVKDKEVEKGQPQEENKEEQKTEEIKKEESTIEIKKEEVKKEGIKREIKKEEVKKEENTVSYPITVNWHLKYRNANGVWETYTGSASKISSKTDAKTPAYSTMHNKIVRGSLTNIEDNKIYTFKNQYTDNYGNTYTSLSKAIAAGKDYEGTKTPTIKLNESTDVYFTAVYNEREIIEPYTVTYNVYYRSAGHGQVDGWVLAGSKDIHVDNSGNTSSWKGVNVAYKAMVGNKVDKPFAYKRTLYTFNNEWKDEDGKTYTTESSLDGQGYNKDTVVNIRAQYKETPLYGVTINYIDHVARGSHSWSTAEDTPFEGYSAIQDEETPGTRMPADIPIEYTFKYWHCDFDNHNYNVGDDFTITQEQITKDTVINLYATYDYQPKIELFYHYGKDLALTKDTGAKLQPIDIYGDSQAPTSIKHWFNDEEGGKPIAKGEKLSLPKKVLNITEPQNIIEKSHVYTHYHGVTFVDENGEDVLKERVEYQYDTDAADIEKPDEPTKEATAQYTYFFNGWMPEIANVIEEVIYKATYRSEVNKYTVTWINEDETTLEVDKNVPYGETPVYNGKTPTKKADAQYTYTFKEWSPEIIPVSGNATYKATYTKTLNKYTVTWENWNNALLEQDLEVPYGETPSYDGDEPKREKTAQHTYTFIGWNPTIEPVTGNITYVAQYAQDINKFKVIWQNWDETILEIDEDVPYGDKPSYDGEAPTKSSTAQFSYEFIGWDPEICEVTDDITYTAQYKEIVNTYTITWVNYNDKVLEKDLKVPYGDTPSYDGATPKKPATSKYTYEFTGWMPTIEKVTGDATYKATFKAVLIPTPPQPDPNPDQEEPETVTKTKTKNKTNNNNNNNTTWILGENAGMGDGIEYTPVSTVKVPLSNKEIPFTAPTENGVWALINLLTVLANFVIAIILLLMIYINNRKEDEETEVKNKVFRRICTLIIAIISVIVFLITEDITLPMVLVDKWTILMIIILIINIIITILSRKKEEEKEETEEE